MQRQRNAPLRSDWLQSFIENKIWFYLLQTDFFCISENSCEKHNFFLFFARCAEGPKKDTGYRECASYQEFLGCDFVFSEQISDPQKRSRMRGMLNTTLKAIIRYCQSC